METCFLTANTFTKSIEVLVPSNKSRVLSYPKKSSYQFQYKRVGLPPSLSITSCHQSSSSQPKDESHPIIDSDWRTFRARLVATEQAIRSNSPLQPPASATDTYQDRTPQQIIIGDKWAHTLHEPEKGCLLIATENLDGVHIFEKTVILLLSVGPTGPFGVILNRPSLMSIKEMRSTAALDVAGTFTDRPLFFGGPMEEGLFLVSPKGGYDVDRVSKSGVLEEVMRGVYYGTKESVGCVAEMVKRNVVGVRDIRFFDGYCGWDKEQLREEINGGYWKVAASSPSVVGLCQSSSLGFWEEVLGLLGPKKVW